MLLDFLYFLLYSDLFFSDDMCSLFLLNSVSMDKTNIFMTTMVSHIFDFFKGSNGRPITEFVEFLKGIKPDFLNEYGKQVSEKLDLFHTSMHLSPKAGYCVTMSHDSPNEIESIELIFSENDSCISKEEDLDFAYRARNLFWGMEKDVFEKVLEHLRQSR